MVKLFRPIALLIGAHLILLSTHAQSRPDTAGHLRTIDQAYGDLKDRNSLAGLSGNDTTIRLLEGLQDRAMRMQELRSILENKLDTADMRESLPRFISMADLLIQNTRENVGKLNFRYLMGLETLTRTMQDNADAYHRQISDQLKHLSDVSRSLQKIGHDSIMDLRGGDSVANRALASEVKALDSNATALVGNYNEQKVELAKYQTMIGELRIKLLELKNLVQAEKKNVQGSIFNKEINYVWESGKGTVDDWRQKIALSNGLNRKIIGDYIGKTLPSTTAMVLLALAFGLIAQWVIPRYARTLQHGEVLRTRTPLISAHPFLAGFILALPLSFLLYADMPMVFVAILSAIFVLFSLPLLWRSAKGIRMALIWGLPAFLFFYYIRLNWETVYALRWLVLLAAMGGLALSIHAGYRLRGAAGIPVVWKWLTGFLFLMSACSVIANFLGRYNLAKISGASGIIGFYRGFALWVLVQVVLEAVYLLLEAGRPANEEVSTAMEHESFVSRFRNLLNILAMATWTYFTLVYLGYWDVLVGSFTSFLQQPHKVGDMVFSYGVVLEFILILMLSAWLASQVAYITTFREQHSTKPRNKRIGSSALLIRLAILTAGFLLALAATKIPIDRLTIVLGALSVGIGFGLQNIIDNLASGIILALERPIQVGDQVEVDGKSGTVKEIGIRSSRIRASDGADLVLPNSHLISNGLVNWTLKDNYKKVDLVIAVANGSDAAEAKRIVEEVVQAQDLLQHPAPQVSYHDLAHNAVQLKASFWVDDPGKAGGQRSAIIGGIIGRFRDAGIRMPEKES